MIRLPRRKPVDVDAPNARRSAFLLILQSARVNGGCYHGESLPAQPIQFPKQTFLQTRLEQVRKEART